MVQGIIKVAVLALSSGLAALLSYQLGGGRGLAGAGVGILFGVVLCAVSHVLLRRVLKADARAIQSTMMLGVLVSFGLMIIFMVAVALLWREILVSSSLTAFGLYLIYRFFEAFEVSRPSSASSGAMVPKEGGGQR